MTEPTPGFYQQICSVLHGTLGGSATHHESREDPKLALWEFQGGVIRLEVRCTSNGAEITLAVHHRTLMKTELIAMGPESEAHSASLCFLDRFLEGIEKFIKFP